jgi:hypothetical protein
VVLSNKALRLILASDILIDMEERWAP